MNTRTTAKPCARHVPIEVKEDDGRRVANGALRLTVPRTAASRGLATGILALFIATPAVAQDLDPRAYAKAPIGLTVAIAGASFSSGGVLTDPTPRGW